MNQQNKIHEIEDHVIESVRLVRQLNIDKKTKRSLLADLELSFVNLEEIGELI